MSLMRKSLSKSLFSFSRSNRIGSNELVCSGLKGRGGESHENIEKGFNDDDDDLTSNVERLRQELAEKEHMIHQLRKQLERSESRQELEHQPDVKKKNAHGGGGGGGSRIRSRLSNLTRSASIISSSLLNNCG